MQEKEILDLIVSQFSWEQVIYHIIELKQLDPWNLDIKVLSTTFLSYLLKLKQLDFTVPAKYIIISAVLLRMKTTDLKILDILNHNEEAIEFSELDDIGFESNAGITENLLPTDFQIPAKRIVKRQVMVSELIAALKNVLKMETKKNSKRSAALRHDFKINQEDIMLKIDELYKKINKLLKSVKTKEIKFSNLIKNQGRDEIIKTFTLLIYLDHNKKITCKQNNIFNEIFIRKRENGEAKN